MINIFTNTSAFKSVGVEMISQIDTCKEFDIKSRDYWRCYLRQNTWPSFHPTSTCRMAVDGSTGVVDSKLRFCVNTCLDLIVLQCKLGND